MLRIGQLQQHEANARQVNKLLESSVRCLADAAQNSITPETRLEAAYRAIIQLSILGLWANGYRASSSKPGHHQTMIQSLVHSVGVDTDDMQLLDSFRVKRNAINYTGEDTDVASVKACLAAGNQLLQHVHQWLAHNRPDLLQ